MALQERYSCYQGKRDKCNNQNAWFRKKLATRYVSFYLVTTGLLRQVQRRIRVSE